MATKSPCGSPDRCARRLDGRAGAQVSPATRRDDLIHGYGWLYSISRVPGLRSAPQRVSAELKMPLHRRCTPQSTLPPSTVTLSSSKHCVCTKRRRRVSLRNLRRPRVSSGDEDHGQPAGRRGSGPGCVLKRGPEDRYVPGRLGLRNLALPDREQRRLREAPPTSTRTCRDLARR